MALQFIIIQDLLHGPHQFGIVLDNPIEPVILEAEFAGDDIELIDDAVAVKRLESGEYTGREREAIGNVS